MNAFEPVPLTAGGLLVTHEEEVELKADSDGIHFFTQKGKKVDTELWAAAGLSLGRCQVVLIRWFFFI